MAPMLAPFGSTHNRRRSSLAGELSSLNDHSMQSFAVRCRSVSAESLVLAMTSALFLTRSSRRWSGAVAARAASSSIASGWRPTAAQIASAAASWPERSAPSRVARPRNSSRASAACNSSIRITRPLTPAGEFRVVISARAGGRRPASHWTIRASLETVSKLSNTTKAAP